jgi:hypothetical protein
MHVAARKCYDFPNDTNVDSIIITSLTVYRISFLPLRFKMATILTLALNVPNNL